MGQFMRSVAQFMRSVGQFMGGGRCKMWGKKQSVTHHEEGLLL